MRFADDFDADDLPILGEALPIELANTWYVSVDGAIDFLATDSLIRLWLRQAPSASVLRPPAKLTAHGTERLRGLRTAVRRLLEASVDADGTIRAADVATLNRTAALALGHSRLEWSVGSEAGVDRVYSGAREPVLLAQVAAAAIDLFAGPDLVLVRRCAHPDCRMLFVQDHHKRRFCNPGCSHRSRQYRYYHARTAPSYPRSRMRT